MADYLSDSYVTVDAAGNVTFNFTGIVHAQGLTLDEVPLASVTATQEVAWVDPATGLIWQFVNGYGDAATASVLRLVALQRAGALTTQVVAQVQTFPIGVGVVRSKVILDNAGNSDFIMDSLLTATGDLIYASAAQTPARLAIGTRGGLLAAQGATTLPAWTAPAATGALPVGGNGADLAWLAAVASGQLLVSAGAATAPKYLAAPAANGAVLAGQTAADAQWVAAGAIGTALTGQGAGSNPAFQDASAALQRSAGPYTIGPSDATEKDLIKQANHAGNTPYQVPAGALGTSRKMRITIDGQFLANSATAANRAYTLRIYFGGNVVYAGALNPRPAQSATKYPTKIVIECDEVGTTAQQFWTIEHTLGNVTAPTTGIGLIGAGVALNDLASSAAPGTAGQTNVNTAIAQNLEITLALVSDPAVSFALALLTIELV